MLLYVECNGRLKMRKNRVMCVNMYNIYIRVRDNVMYMVVYFNDLNHFDVGNCATCESSEIAAFVLKTF